MRISTKGTRKLSPVNASTSINRSARRKGSSIAASSKSVKLSPSKQRFADTLKVNCKRASQGITASTSITAATNTANIMARPDFQDLLPLFVQKLYILDVFGSVAMNSRSQFIPYFKFVADSDKGETSRGSVLSSPFMNRQGADHNFTGRVVKNEIAITGDGTSDAGMLAYGPVLPGSLTLHVEADGQVKTVTDNNAGGLVAADGTDMGTINYATGAIEVKDAKTAGTVVTATYQYDNETVGPDPMGKIGARIPSGRLDLDEINLVAEAQALSCYSSVYSAFAAEQEYGASINDLAKEAAIGEITAEITAKGFAKLADAAQYNPQFDWDASPVLTGAVVPTDYLKMFKLKLAQASAAVYQATRLSKPNRLVVGSNAGAYIEMVEGFEADTSTDNAGPYRLGKLEQFEIFCDPNYDPDMWVMACKNDDIRRNSALFGEYMPISATDPVVLADQSVQTGIATMNAMEIVNKDTIVSGRITGTF